MLWCFQSLPVLLSPHQTEKTKYWDFVLSRRSSVVLFKKLNYSPSDREAIVFTVFQYSDTLVWVVSVLSLNWRGLLLQDLHQTRLCLPLEDVWRQLDL